MGRARAGANCGANPGVGDAVWRATQGVGNDEWRRNSPRPFGFGLFRGACVVANARRAARHGCALRLACAPKQTERGPDPKPDRLLVRMDLLRGVQKLALDVVPDLVPDRHSSAVSMAK